MQRLSEIAQNSNDNVLTETSAFSSGSMLLAYVIANRHNFRLKLLCGLAFDCTTVLHARTRFSARTGTRCFPNSFWQARNEDLDIDVGMIADALGEATE